MTPSRPPRAAWRPTTVGSALALRWPLNGPTRGLTRRWSRARPGTAKRVTDSASSSHLRIGKVLAEWGLALARWSGWPPNLVVVDPLALGEAYQGTRDSRSRRASGEHYTPETVVLRTLGPLFLDDARSVLRNRNRSTAQGHEPELRALWTRISALRFLDPACGSGNFLVVAYRELRRIEAEVLAALGASCEQPRVHLGNFYGIEIDAGAARVACHALRLAEQQCNAEFLSRFRVRPSLSGPPTIVVGNALTMDWTTVCPPSASVVVAGNPPFLGSKERSSTQAADLRTAWGSRYSGMLDYVSGWFAKASCYCSGEWAFVATSSIVQGGGVPTLFGTVFDAGWRIKFAHRPFAWPAPGGAAVHCVIVGFTRDRDAESSLFEWNSGDGSEQQCVQRVRSINAYLIDGPDVLVRPRRTPLAPDLPPVTAGSKAADWGNLTVEPTDYEEIAADPIASKYLRPYRGGEELINARERWCLWFEGASLESLYASPLLAPRLDAVRALRLASAKPATRAAAVSPHLFLERRQPMASYLGIPQTFTNNRPYATAARLSPNIVASIKLFTSPDPDGFLFGLISSSVFLTWQKTVGGRLKSDPSFTSTVVWNTLPLPRTSARVRREIAAAGRRVYAARDANQDLSAQYASMSTSLTAAHASLDSLVDDMFGVIRRTRREALLTSYVKLQKILQ